MIYFSETQHYNFVLIAICFVLLALVILFLYRYTSNKIYLALTFPYALLLFYFSTLTLDVHIDAYGIGFKLSPTRSIQRIKWEDISKIYLKDNIVYSRYNLEYDVYALNDKYGLYIVLKNGKSIILGTKKPNEIQKVLDSLSTK